nr:site-specific integrase [Lysinibacillus parviboronicapiens]
MYKLDKSNLKVLVTDLKKDKIVSDDDFQAEMISNWEKQQIIKGYTAGTINLNLKSLNEFLQFSGKFIWELDNTDVDEYYYMMVGKALSYSTRRKYQSAISSFLDYARSRYSGQLWQRYNINFPILFDKFNKHYHRKDDVDRVIIPPKKEVLEQFWDALKQEMLHSRKYAPLARDYVMFRVMELAGLRTNELVMLDVKDIRFDLGEKGKIHVRYGKGSNGMGYKKRWVPMMNDLDGLLKWYLETIRSLFTEVIEGPMFLNESKNRISKDAVRNNLRRRQKNVGILESEQFSPHQLRHAFATIQTEAGVDLYTMKELLGHTSITTTVGYATPGSEYLEKQIKIAQKRLKDMLIDYEKK